MFHIEMNRNRKVVVNKDWFKILAFTYKEDKVKVITHTLINDQRQSSGAADL